jgi:adenosylmethionine-8-amino-7-oxononanoate aminotransferase
MNKELKYFLNGEYKKEVIYTDRYLVYFKNESKPYLDLQCGYSSFILGYNNKEIYGDIEREYDVQFVRGVTSESNIHVDNLASKLCSLGNWSSIAWTTSGSDAVEAAYEMNRKYWNLVNPNKNKILVFLPNYHGTTLLEKHFRREISNMDICKFAEVMPWNNYSEREYSEKILLDVVRQMLMLNQKIIGAILMESIPWFDYLQPWSNNFWTEIKKICEHFDINLIVDDVAGCFGKEGTWYSNNTYNIEPDIVAIGKALTAGYAPMGAALCNKKIHKVISKEIWEHTHTYYPSMYGVLIANRVINHIESNLLFDKINSINNRIRKICAKYNITVIGDHLLMALHFPKNISIMDIFQANAIVSLPIKGYNNNILKICAPLIADSEYFSLLELTVNKLYDKPN